MGELSIIIKTKMFMHYLYCINLLSFVINLIHLIALHWADSVYTPINALQLT